jgi:hypothetical protein
MSATSNRTLWSRFINVVGVVDKGVNYGLGEWGALVAQRPILTMVTSFIVSLGLMAGLVLIADSVENASDKLWCALKSLRVHMCSVYPRYTEAVLRIQSNTEYFSKLPN